MSLAFGLVGRGCVSLPAALKLQCVLAQGGGLNPVSGLTSSPERRKDSRQRATDPQRRAVEREARLIVNLDGKTAECCRALGRFEALAREP
ncbi:MAG: hypothetical protein AAGK78_17685, partial [Planctomycetota bacterium]